MLIREALIRFHDMHEQYKAGALTSREALAQYEAEREAFTRAFVEAQQLALKPGFSPRQTLRVARTERLALQIGPRREGTITVDIGIAGFAAQVGPLAVRIVCDFELGTEPAVVKGRARVVASASQPDGSFRTSFAIDSMTDDDRKRLEIWVLDYALKAVAKR
jgi:hypothetical protein